MVGLWFRQGPGALAEELGPTMAVARLLSEDGQRDQARHLRLLASTTGSQEGFETAGLKLAARAARDLR